MALETGLVESFGFAEASGNGVGLVASTVMTHNSVTYGQGSLSGVGYDGLVDYSTVAHASDPISNYNAPWSKRFNFEILSQVSAGDDWVFTKWNNVAGQNYFALVTNGTTNNIKLHTAGGGALSLGANTAGVHDVLITSDGSGNLKAYLAGALIGTAVDGGDAMTGSALTRIATRGSLQYANITGNELNSWNRELTLAEATELYNGGDYKFYNGYVFGPLTLATGLVGTVSFETTTSMVDDISADALTSAGVATITDPKGGDGLLYDGVSDYTHYTTWNSDPFSADLSLDWTLTCLFVKTGDNTGYIFNASGTGNNDKFYLFMTAGKLQATLLAGSALATAGTMDDGINMVAISSDGEVYLNGVSVLSLTAGASTGVGDGYTGRFAWGALSSTFAQKLDAEIYQTLMYDRILTPAELVALWGGGSPLVRDSEGNFASLSTSTGAIAKAIKLALGII
jgi:hypothetical protein